MRARAIVSDDTDVGGKSVESTVIDHIRKEHAKQVDEAFKESLEAAEEGLARHRSESKEGFDMYEAPIVLRVKRQFSEEGDLVTEPEEETETIAVSTLHTEPAYVRLKAGHTNNVAKFWSVTVQISVDVPCHKEELDGALKFASKTVEKHLVQEVKKATERSEHMRGGSGHPF